MHAQQPRQPRSSSRESVVSFCRNTQPTEPRFQVDVAPTPSTSSSSPWAQVQNSSEMRPCPRSQTPPLPHASQGGPPALPAANLLPPPEASGLTFPPENLPLPLLPGLGPLPPTDPPPSGMCACTPLGRTYIEPLLRVVRSTRLHTVRSQGLWRACRAC